MHGQTDIRFLNQPVKLWWAGWETDTLKLGREGWQISAHQDIRHDQMQIAIKHPKANIQGITFMESFAYRDWINGRGGFASAPVSLRFELMGQEIRIHQMGSPAVREFRPIDYRPRYDDAWQSKITTLDDFAHFETIVEEAQHEIYLHEANISQILDMALQVQAPQQEQIRKDMIDRQEMDRLRRGKLHTELRLVA